MREQNSNKRKSSAMRSSSGGGRRSGAARGDRRSGAARGDKRSGAARGNKHSGGSRSERTAGVSRSRSGERGLRSVERPVKRKKSEIEAIRSQVEGREPIKVERRLPLQSYTPKPRKPKAHEEEGVRLNKFIANSGICSRREADEYIVQGLVTVNGQVVTELGTKVFYSDEVRFDGGIIKGEQKVYILMNKPKDFITTTSDPHAHRTVLDLIAGRCKERVYPVGRLDRDTTGVLLITNDGDMTEKLTHPSYRKKKIYQVTLDKNLKALDFEKVLKGVYLDDGLERADALSYVDGDESVVGIEIHSGKNRVVRRLFEALGQWRFLSEKEIVMLKMGSYE